MTKNTKSEIIANVIGGAIGKLLIIALAIWVLAANIPLVVSGNFTFWNIIFLAFGVLLSFNIIRAIFKPRSN